MGLSNVTGTIEASADLIRNYNISDDLKTNNVIKNISISAETIPAGDNNKVLTKV